MFLHEFRDFLVAFIFLSYLSTFASAGICTSPLSTPASDAFPMSASDFLRLNTLLTSPDRQKRLQELPNWLAKKPLATAEQLHLQASIQLALAQAQAADNKISAAKKTLEDFPLDDSLSAQAIFLRAQLDISEHPQAAQQWLIKLAQIFPDHILAIDSLFQAAQLEASLENRINFLFKAKQRISTRLSNARYWREKLMKSDYTYPNNIDDLPLEFTQSVEKGLADKVFIQESENLEKITIATRCIEETENNINKSATDDSHLNEIKKADETLSVVIPKINEKISALEIDLNHINVQLKSCKKTNSDCQDIHKEQVLTGQQLTLLRNKIKTLSNQQQLFRTETSLLSDRLKTQYEESKYILNTLKKEKENHESNIRDLLINTISFNIKVWEKKSAEIHYQLALAQEGLLRQQRQQINKPPSS